MFDPNLIQNDILFEYRGSMRFMLPNNMLHTAIWHRDAQYDFFLARLKLFLVAYSPRPGKTSFRIFSDMLVVLENDHVTSN